MISYDKPFQSAYNQPTQDKLMNIDELMHKGWVPGDLTGRLLVTLFKADVISGEEVVTALQQSRVSYEGGGVFKLAGIK